MKSVGGRFGRREKVQWWEGELWDWRKSKTIDTYFFCQVATGQLTATINRLTVTRRGFVVSLRCGRYLSFEGPGKKESWHSKGMSSQRQKGNRQDFCQGRF